MTEVAGNIGIIAGRGLLPIELAHKGAALGYKIFVICLSGFAKIQDFKNFTYFECSLGQVGKIFSFLHQKHVTDLIFSGKVERPKWHNLLLDSQGAKLLANILKNKLLGDNTIMNVINSFVQNNGFKVISAFDILGNVSQLATLTNSFIPSADDIVDFKIGFNAAKTIGQLDIGQSVIIESGRIIAVEGAEGTDGLIKRAKNLKVFDSPSGVLIKVAKPDQLITLDPPTIGVDTVIAVADAGLRGIAIEKNNVVVVNLPQVIDLADRLGIFIYII